MYGRVAVREAHQELSLFFFANTTYQFRTDLPPGVEVMSITQLDADELGSKYDEFIRVLLRGLELPERFPSTEQWASIVTGQAKAPSCPILEADVHESLAALMRPCSSKSEFRYQLAAAVVLNAWIEDERRLGYVGRKNLRFQTEDLGACEMGCRVGTRRRHNMGRDRSKRAEFSIYGSMMSISVFRRYQTRLPLLVQGTMRSLGAVSG